MKKTFTTVMPDQAGTFIKVYKCLSDLGLSVTRISYNKAVDTHMLFIEAEGPELLIKKGQEELEKMGYLKTDSFAGGIILLEFKLPDEPGALFPVLKLIKKYKFNISYISSQKSPDGYQSFKTGIFVENSEEIAEFMQEASMLCPVNTIDYDRSEKVLDNTVFYISFSEEIAERLNLTEEEKGKLIVNSNKIMQILDDNNSPPYKTFDYIRRTAEHIQKYKGSRYFPRITATKAAGGCTIDTIEPPCGSNTYIMRRENSLLFVDSGFACYGKELFDTCRTLYPDFDKIKKELILTHSDIDHSGCMDLFDKVYMCNNQLIDFKEQKAGRPEYRGKNPLHHPFVKISKIVSSFKDPKLDNVEIIGGDDSKITSPLQKLGDVSLPPFNFEMYEGMGGHVKGETVFIERTQKIVFSGDIYVNIKGFTKEQAKFNKLAPYLMASVDSDPELAKRERLAIFDLLDEGTWKIFGGHGSVYEYKVL